MAESRRNVDGGAWQPIDENDVRELLRRWIRDTYGENVPEERLTGILEELKKRVTVPTREERER